ncbi:hypothetical protein A7A08_00796 [Methyloligella halotolerans]|uniref:IrrE N-terminal-like domain-containing protein n=1 Tax=Methyloligella halotolerans TaxID=1177755 RepID=A0A1E2S3I4_9HYPH|nr:hypothetical protein [Methyloligella halotolerans]ODA68962.1 hypothetical protein A7A08_00796 [Methyloligella halotolerans]
MTKPDDSSLDPEDLRAVEERAARLLDRADAWDRFPIPIDDILAAADVQVSSSSAFDAAAIVAYLKGKAAHAGEQIKSAISKVFGLYDAGENLIHIDETVVESKQTFLKLHETAHHDMPTHRKVFRFFQDCEKTLSPEIVDQFEREANNFARFALFKGDLYAEYAADCAFEIKTPMKLAKKFGSSVYASVREFARTNHKACVVYVLQPLEYVQGDGAQASVRRIEPSHAFKAQFGQPTDTVITPDHYLWPVIPVGRKMTPPVSLSLIDKNGDAHECLAEAFDTTYNILILLYPVKALTSSSAIILPPGCKEAPPN